MIHKLGAAPIRVLIVEDNRDICANIAAYLEQHNYILDFAYDGISAMHLALTTPFDVIVLDLMLPGMDGLTLIKSLRALPNFKTTPILMLTTESSDAMKSQGRAAGATGWLRLSNRDGSTIGEIASGGSPKIGP